MADTEELRVYLRTIVDLSDARQLQAMLRGFERDAVRMGAAAGVGGVGVHELMRAIESLARFVGDSIDELREHQRITLGTSAAYATWATEVKNLDAAFARAEKTGTAFQVLIGRLAEPAALAGIKGIGQVLEGITGGLTNTSKALAQLAKDHPWLFQGLAAAPGPVADIVSTIADQFVAAGQSIQKEERAIAQRSQEQRMRRLREINVLPSTDAVYEAQRIHFFDQVGAAVRDAKQAQQAQVDLQRESVNLAAQEAQIRLSLLPAQERMAELQRQVAEQQIRARQAALPATEALEDVRYLQQRAQLIAQNRNVGVEQRIGARRELRAIGRALPGVELGALEAERRLTLAGRPAERVGLEAQLFEISTQRQLAQIEQLQVANGYLSQMAAQRTQAIELTINLSAEEFQKEVYKQLVEAEKQAQGPTVIKLSGVRR